MTVPSTRTPVRIARGSYANLTTANALAALDEGELAFATDTDQLYVKKGAVLVPVSSADDGNDFSGDYNDLINKPDIPDATSDLVNDSGFITAAEAPVQPEDVFSGDYDDLINKPTIPPAYDDSALAGRVATNEADIAQLQTDVGNISGFSGDYNDLTNKPDIPSATSDLTNDSGFITAADVPAGFSGDYNDLTNKPSIPSTPGDIGAATAAQGALADSAIQPGVVNPVYFANQAAFPDANTNHGAIAHSHADGAMYFAHGGVWNRMANTSEIPAINNIDISALDTLP